MKGGTVALNKIAGGNIFTTVKGKKGYALIPDDPKEDPTVFFTNVEDMFKQFGYSSKANEFRTNMRAITNQKNPTVKTATNAEWLKAGWTQDQINKAVQSGQIKVK